MDGRQNSLVVDLYMVEKKQTLSERKRESIINAAKQAFKEFGVESTSMDKIAELAQVSKRTVYNHFSSKEVLVAQLLAELWNQAMVQINQTYDSTLSLETQLGSMLQQEVSLVGSSEYIDLARVAFGHYLFKPEAIMQELSKYVDEDTALFKWLSAARLDQRLDIDDIEKAYAQVHNLIKGSCFWPQLMQIAPVLSSDERDLLVDDTVAMFLSRYRT